MSSALNYKEQWMCKTGRIQISKVEEDGPTYLIWSPRNNPNLTVCGSGRDIYEATDDLYESIANIVYSTCGAVEYLNDKQS